MMEYNGTWHTYRMDPVPGEDGEFQGLVSRILDAGDSVRLQAVTEQLNHLMAATDNAVVMTGPDHRIVRWNAGFERVFGYGADNLEGTLIHDLIPSPSRKMFAGYADRAIQSGGVQQFSMESLKKDGDVANVAVSMTPVHDPGGAVTGMVILSRDVTGEHEVDMRLVRHMADTAVKINGPLSHMRTNLEEAVAALQEGILTTEELVTFLTVLMKSIGHIEENLGEMNRVAIDGIDGVPAAFREYLSR